MCAGDGPAVSAVACLALPRRVGARACVVADAFSHLAEHVLAAGGPIVKGTVREWSWCLRSGLLCVPVGVWPDAVPCHRVIVVGTLRQVSATNDGIFSKLTDEALYSGEGAVLVVPRHTRNLSRHGQVAGPCRHTHVPCRTRCSPPHAAPVVVMDVQAHNGTSLASSRPQHVVRRIERRWRLHGCVSCPQSGAAGLALSPPSRCVCEICDPLFSPGVMTWTVPQLMSPRATSPRASPRAHSPRAQSPRASGPRFLRYVVVAPWSQTTAAIARRWLLLLSETCSAVRCR